MVGEARTTGGGGVGQSAWGRTRQLGAVHVSLGPCTGLAIVIQRGEDEISTSDSVRRIQPIRIRIRSHPPEGWGAARARMHLAIFAIGRLDRDGGVGGVEARSIRVVQTVAVCGDRRHRARTMEAPLTRRSVGRRLAAKVDPVVPKPHVGARARTVATPEGADSLVSVRACECAMRETRSRAGSRRERYARGDKGRGAGTKESYGVRELQQQRRRREQDADARCAYWCRRGRCHRSLVPGSGQTSRSPSIAPRHLRRLDSHGSR